MSNAEEALLLIGRERGYVTYDEVLEAFPEAETNFGTACIQHGQAANKIYLNEVKKSVTGIRSQCLDGVHILENSAKSVSDLQATDTPKRIRNRAAGRRAAAARAAR